MSETCDQITDEELDAEQREHRLAVQEEYVGDNWEGPEPGDVGDGWED